MTRLVYDFMTHEKTCEDVRYLFPENSAHTVSVSIYHICLLRWDHYLVFYLARIMTTFWRGSWEMADRGPPDAALFWEARGRFERLGVCG